MRPPRPPAARCVGLSLRVPGEAEARKPSEGPWLEKPGEDASLEPALLPSLSSERASASQSQEVLSGETAGRGARRNQEAMRCAKCERRPGAVSWGEASKGPPSPVTCSSHTSVRALPLGTVTAPTGTLSSLPLPRTGCSRSIALSRSHCDAVRRKAVRH